MNLPTVARRIGVSLLMISTVYTANAGAAWTLLGKFTRDLDETAWTSITSTDTPDECRARFKKELAELQESMNTEPFQQTIDDTQAQVAWYLPRSGGSQILVQQEYKCVRDDSRNATGATDPGNPK